ncbi:MAG TPA: SpoIVB peptidase S55 domain-containing protein [Acidobacteriaceae bacterium]|jgi:hypothetical protein|nr:SpoIVB peptidase S55 domain-containing protein [Acidobacteriaceae bacterium]
MNQGTLRALLAGSVLATGAFGFSDCSPAQVKDVAAVAHFPTASPLHTKFFPLSEVHRGLHGVAYTVFEGVTPEPMDVEILGVLKDAIGPGQDMILARLQGEKPEYTGVVAGMSGSPVYVDGRLVGALSYRIGQFSKDPIAGITPIEQMLEVRDGQPGGPMRVADKSQPSTGSNSADKPVAAAGEIQPIETALVFGGFSRDTVDRFGESFRTLGLTPVAGLGGAAPAGTKQPEPLVPGSAVSAILVRGDLSMAGTCTVTYVDPTQLLACGHPITQFGSVSMPMTKAEVVTTLASPLNSFKIVNTTETIGAFTEDRASAILGRFGDEAQMIPVSVEVVPHDAPQPRPVAGLKHVAAQIQEIPNAGTGPAILPHKGGMHFEVLNNRQLTPAAMLASVYQSLSGTNQSGTDVSYRLHGELMLKGLPPVQLQGIMSPTDSNSGAANAALFVNDRFSRLYANSVEQPDIAGLKLRLEAIPERHTAILESARLDQMQAHPGDTLDVEATLHPYAAEPRVVRLKAKLPDDLTPGLLRVVISDGATVDRLSTASGLGGQHAVSMADTVAQMNRLHSNDGVYVTLLDHSPQAALDTQALPGVPLSMANVLEPLKSTQKMQLTGESAIEAGSAQTDYAITGAQVLTLEVQ